MSQVKYALKSYQSEVRKKMDHQTIIDVSRKLPGWFDHLFGYAQNSFVTQDKSNKVWHVSITGDCFCEETGETR